MELNILRKKKYKKTFFENIPLKSIINITTKSCDYESNRKYKKCIYCNNYFHVSKLSSQVNYYSNYSIYRYCKYCVLPKQIHIYTQEQRIKDTLYNKEEINFHILICNHINKSFKNILHSNLRIYLKEVYILTLPYTSIKTKNRIIELLNKCYN